jgi:hypothetical protein
MNKNLPLAAATIFFVVAAGFWAIDAATPARADWYGPGPGYGYNDGPPPHGEYYGGGWGHHEGFRHHEMGPCGARGAYMIERMDRFVSRDLELNGTQEAAWKDVVDTADAARVKAKEACADQDDWKGTAPERLARAEAMMQAGLDAVHEVRPKFDAFYDTLTDRQKQRLDDMTVARHGHRR